MITKINDHVAQALDNLLTELKRQTIRDVLSACVEPVQDTEDTSVDLILERQLSTAVGVQLDAYGKVVGAARRSLSDADYRKYIRVRIQANRGSGQADTILDVVAEIVGVPVTYYLSAPAAYKLQWAVSPSTSPDMVALLGELILQMTPAGVGFDAVEGPTGAKQFDTAGLGFDLGLFGSTILTS